MTDPIDDALGEIQDRCKTSWSENEIIRLIGNVREMRRAEFQQTSHLQAVAEKAICPRPNERWG